ncbi:OmpA family protein [Oecophyllibacter saccharovorans]|nr:OmpA family protein [Oecophyllibacter saccharovorans]QDH15645.1 OmpA family protein [Oecophyllibacter saccharovorans]QDH15646.1 OmpA family protein [Oecophyllibacter saccharovorans]TPW36664.1 OmpA family protein [Oecophyllibacter saccharovorans]
MRLRTALLSMASMAALPSVSMATTITGPYIDMAGGYDYTQAQGMTQHTNKGINGTLHSGDGYTGYLSAGWGFGNGLRLEVEGTYSRSYNSHGTFRGTGMGAGRMQAGIGHSGLGRHGLSGSNQNYGGFVNVLYDIDLAQFGMNAPVTPFVGIGAGYLYQDYKIHGTKSNHVGSVMNQSIGNGGFAAQAIVGAAWDTGFPGLAVTTQYRFIAQTGSNTGVNIGKYHSSTGQRIDTGSRYSHQFLLGLRYAFDTAPPAPPVVVAPIPPAPTPARTYLVFFDWDRYNLTSRAREIVAQAAQASTHVQTTRIEVNGYTDTSHAGSAAAGARYNMGLSLRRANSVKAELIRDGVPASAIDIHGYGESHPLVATGPNSREPQNRRVEIILR